MIPPPCADLEPITGNPLFEEVEEKELVKIFAQLQVGGRWFVDWLGEELREGGKDGGARGSV